MNAINHARLITTLVRTYDLVIALEHAIKHASDDSKRPHLCGVLFVRLAKRVRLVATDGHRLARFEVDAKEGAEGAPLLLRLADCRLLLASLKQAVRAVGKASRGMVGLALTAPVQPATDRPSVVSATVLAGDRPLGSFDLEASCEEFPPYERVIPEHALSTDYLGRDGATIQAVNPRYFTEAIEACAHFGQTMLVQGRYRDPLVFRAEDGTRALVVVMPERTPGDVAAEQAAKADPRR
jgi:hypothetical protein